MPYADYQLHLEKNRERQKTRRGAANHLRANLAYRRRNKKKAVAHNAVAKAILRGKLVPWPCCALPTCMETKVEAHHADYDDQLGVVWLCAPHHKEAHALGRHLKGKA